MPTTTSIDSFLHTHNSNKKLVLMGKLAIARCLLVAERKSPLYRKDVHVPLDLTPVEGTWYAEFFKLLSDQVAEPECIFRNLAIISFNYDRSLEYYLLHALMRRFLIAKEKAEQIMKSLSIYHPYGAVGPLPWEVTGSAIHYGGEEYHGELLRSSEGLRTFSEGVEEGFAGKIREEIKAATTILLIGFGYAPINMDLLRVTGDLVPKPVYATAFDIHPTEKDTLRRSLGAALGVMTSSIGLHFGTTGADLFRSCRISFAAL